jgi:hypothetical protein
MFPEEDGNRFEVVVTDKRPQIRVEFDNEGARKPVEPEEIILDEFVEVMGAKAKGKKLSNHPVSAITWLDPIPVEEEEEIELEDADLNEEGDGEEGELGEEVDGIEETEGNDEKEVSAEIAPPVITEKVKKEKVKKEETKTVIPPVKPPDFPDDDDEGGTGIQLALF